MIKNFKILLLVILVAVSSCSFTSKNIDNSDRDTALLSLITYAVEQAHFSPRAIDDEFSSLVYHRFIDDLDPLKRFFLESDIKEFSKYEFLIDDQIKNRDLSFFNLVYDRFMERTEQAKAFYPKLLETPFNFNTSLTIDLENEDVPYKTTQDELMERWRKLFKYNALINYHDTIEQQNKDKEKAEEEGTDFEIKSLTEIEEEARESTKTNIEDYFAFTDDLDRDDYFSVFLNAITVQFDPHTNYMAPQTKDRFETAMSGRLEGIGAQLQKQRETIRVADIIPGGPAWRSQQLEVGDLITRVRQEGEEEAVNVGPMRLDDAVQLIRGPKGTKVILTVKKVDGSIEDITLERDIVELQETFAKSAVIEKDDLKFGIIDVPRFYFNMNDRNGRDAASDVKEEIKRLKEEGVKGLILDFRGNGGGSLQAAIEMAGLFVERGPVVQVAMGSGQVEVLRHRNNKIEWDGPLVVMVNQTSASASEIIAAAMQDYNRAIVIGSEQTYGKGTVQNLQDLNRWLRNNPHGDLGALKITTQKFYRINGGSTQLKGVQSDVVLPTRLRYVPVGERDYENPMPYSEIRPASFRPWQNVFDFESAIKASNERVAASEQFNLINEQAIWVKERRNNRIVSLNYDAFVAEIEQNRERSKIFDAISEYKNNLTFRSHNAEALLKENDEDLAEMRSRWHESLEKDAYVEEGVNILFDLSGAKANEVAKTSE